MADTTDSKSVARKGVRVQIPPRARTDQALCHLPECAAVGDAQDFPFMALSVALLGVKGGVGKTTTAVNLAGLAAMGGLRTLVWDLDPQAAASFALGFDKKGRSAARHLTRKRTDLSDAVFRTTTPGLDLIPADVSLRTLDLALAERPRSRKKIGDALASIDEQYDAVFIDCPPGITLANESAIAPRRCISRRSFRRRWRAGRSTSSRPT